MHSQVFFGLEKWVSRHESLILFAFCGWIGLDAQSFVYKFSLRERSAAYRAAGAKASVATDRSRPRVAAVFFDRHL